MKNKGITLVALVITIIILLILAGITISQLTGSGLFENARLAEEKSKEAQEKEKIEIEQMTNNIEKYVMGNRQFEKKSLLNTDDVIYNVTEKGYIFETPTSQKTFTTNNIINLRESIEEYDYVEFLIDIKMKSINGYVFRTSDEIYTSQIIGNYNNTDSQDLSKSYIIIDDTGDCWSRIICSFVDDKTIKVEAGYGNYVGYTNLRITDIIGVKNN